MTALPGTARVRLLGQPRIESAAGQPHRPPRGQKCWAVLGRVALAERPLTRSELAAELFCDADDPLGALRWCLAELRRCLADPKVLRGDPVRIGPDALWLDVWALADGSLPPAEIGGVLLDGADVRNCPAFDVWLMLARGRCAARSMEELRQSALRLLAAGDSESAAETAGRLAALDPLDENAQELFLRMLVAAGHPARATIHLMACEANFAAEGMRPSAALRAAARPPADSVRPGLRASVVAASLLRAGSAALDAGSADAGIETLRRAADEAQRGDDLVLRADVLRALGTALVHAVRGFDGEGSVILHQALAAVSAAASQDSAASDRLSAEIQRELAFADLQAGRHASAARALADATAAAEAVGDGSLTAGVLAIRGMNEADQGRHDLGIQLLGASAELAAAAGSRRQEAWSAGLMARSLLQAGCLDQARAAAERSVHICRRERWNAFLPWPQAVRAHCLIAAGDLAAARDDAEDAYALACQLGDPCWEGMAGRALAVLAAHAGDKGAAVEWITDARRRCDRVPDRYVWVSSYVALGHLEIAARQQPELVQPLAARLFRDALRADLPEFVAWAVIYQAEAGEFGNLPFARTLTAQVVNPALRARAAALAG